MVPVVEVGYSIEFEENEGIAVADEHDHHKLEEEETFLLSCRYRTL